MVYYLRYLLEATIKILFGEVILPTDSQCLLKESCACCSETKSNSRFLVIIACIEQNSNDIL